MSTSVFERGQRCLVLNKGWTPVGTVSLQRAIIMLFSMYQDGEPKARVIESDSYAAMTWDDWSKIRPGLTDDVIHGANIKFKVPEILLLSRYDRLPQPKVHFSRRNLYKRDKLTCQYCGDKPGSQELSIDHIIPRAQGGKTTWENVVLACVKCNRRKADKTPKQAGMKLAKIPKKPHLRMFNLGSMKSCESWRAFISEAYWNTEMGD